MTKLCCAYLAGVLSTAGFVYLAGGRAAAVMFALGILATVACAAAALGSTRRIRRAARFLSSFAQAIEGSSSKKTGELRIMKTPAPAPVSAQETDLISALRNMGMSRRDATTAARYAIGESPAGDFDALFKLAVARKAAA
jgi:hypothetical protein